MVRRFARQDSVQPHPNRWPQVFLLDAIDFWRPVGNGVKVHLAANDRRPVRQREIAGY